MIKKTTYIALAALTLTACDNIPEDDRYFDIPFIEPARTVLLEEYTGQECTNCPQGHAIAESLVGQYGSSVIPVSIHAGNLSYGEEDTWAPGLRVPEGQAYYEKAGSPNLPSAVADRRGTPADRSEWAKMVREAMALPSTAEISLTANIVDGKINITVNAIATADLQCKLQLWVTENHISAYQVDNSNIVMDYEHNHVLRGAINGTWGEDISIAKSTVGQSNPLTREYSLTPKPAWNLNNLSIVAFLYDNTGVIQATQSTLPTP